MSEVGERLREVAKLNHMTLKDLANKSGITYRSIQNYALGKQLPGADALIKLRDTIKVDINWLLTGEDRDETEGAAYLDSQLFNRAAKYLRETYPNELGQVQLEFLVPDVAYLYNSALKCNNQREIDLVWSSQVEMIKAVDLRQFIDNLLSVLPEDQRASVDALDKIKSIISER
ncbi:MAG: helix-turn-helix domain-containing protein [Pseudomonadales bacterium]